ncbi:hypothetical protein BDF20DRAFT_857571 [Mycotypha africana]|uniref:uncharacterized protein n=1 Tax=Mycotypha africana TaxID=64632 RepID=UPI002300D685|nr:uncharacterized protein BDF20DRAFT_857571 [Mycotypha africana]KAI8984016.1 hypothetical protein BDF20DRAFT_857571 [Mycotypha africana]
MTSTCYWYSTNGMMQRRLPLHHLAILDQAFERHARIQLLIEEEEDLFFSGSMTCSNPKQQQQQHKHIVTITANPYQGTMTAGDLHYGLYRQPPLWRISDASLDTLILLDDDGSEESIDKKNRKSRKSNSQKDDQEENIHPLDSNIDRLAFTSTTTTTTAAVPMTNKTGANSSRAGAATRHINRRFLRREHLLRQNYMEDNCGACCIIS